MNAMGLGEGHCNAVRWWRVLHRLPTRGMEMGSPTDHAIGHVQDPFCRRYAGPEFLPRRELLLVSILSSTIVSRCPPLPDH